MRRSRQSQRRSREIQRGHSESPGNGIVRYNATSQPNVTVDTLVLESLGFARNFLSSCELEALHFIGIRSFGEEFREDVVFRGIQEKFRKPLA